MANKQGVVLTRASRHPPLDPEIAFVLEGRVLHADARDCADVPFEECSPVRSFPAWKGKRHYSGLYWSQTTTRHIGFESFAERSTLLLLDRESSVVAISSQPMWIAWPAHYGGRRHAPDFFARHSNGDGEVIDVRPEGLLDDRARDSFSATRALCEAIGFRYRVFSDFDDIRDRNLRFLARYAIDAWAPPEEALAVLALSDWPTTIGTLAATLRSSNGRNPLGWVYAMLWSGILTADLDRTLSTGTILTQERKNP